MCPVCSVNHVTSLYHSNSLPQGEREVRLELRSDDRIFCRIRANKMNLIRFIAIFTVVFCCHGWAAAQMRNVRVCTPGLSPAFTYLNVAQERGYFAQEKLHVEILAARGQLCITALLAEQIGFTTNPTAFDLMVEGKLKGKVLYNAARGLAHRLIVAPDIKSYADLKGKTLAIST